MGLFSFGKMSDVTFSYDPCSEECPKCRKGRCTRQEGHLKGLSSDAGHLSVRGWNEALQTEGCGHSW